MSSLFVLYGYFNLTGGSLNTLGELQNIVAVLCSSQMEPEARRLGHGGRSRGSHG